MRRQCGEHATCGINGQPAVKACPHALVHEEDEDCQNTTCVHDDGKLVDVPVCQPVPQWKPVTIRLTSYNRGGEPYVNEIQAEIRED